MKNVNTTETLETLEAQSEGSVQGDARRAARKLHPVLLMWLGTRAHLFMEQPARGSDLVNKAAEHGDVKKIRAAFPQTSLETAVKMAWVVWRARQVQFWTRNLDRDTYAKDGNLTVLVHKGVNTVTWEQAVQHADAREDSDTHNLAMERRARYYTAQEKRREEEEAIALTIGAVDLRKPAQGDEDKAEIDRLSAQKVGENNEQPRDNNDGRVARQQELRTKRVNEEKIAAKTAVKPIRRSKKPVQGLVQRITAKANAAKK